MNLILIILLFVQAPTKNEHEIGEEVIKGEAALRIEEQKIYLSPVLIPLAQLDSVISQERYIFDDKLRMTIDILNTPILYLHSEYLRIPIMGKLMHSSIALFVPRFEKTVSSWELVITNTNGEVVRRYAQTSIPPNSIAWDGRTDTGEMCNMGEVYNYVFTAFDAAGNPTRITGQPYKFNGLVYDEKNSMIVAIAADVLFDQTNNSVTKEGATYLDEVVNLIKANFKKEVVVYSYSESEPLTKSRGEAIMEEIINRTVLPKGAIKTVPKFIPGLKPKFSKIEIIIQ